MAQRWRTTINVINREFFQVLLITYLCFTLAEATQEGFVSNFFNMNYLLLAVLGTGIAMVVTEPPESEIRRAVETATTEVARASQAVHNRVVRPAVDTIRTIGTAKVIDLRDADPKSHQIRPRSPQKVNRTTRHW